MTKEELEKDAEEKAEIYFDSLDYDHGNVSDTPFSAYDIFVAYKKGALDFAEPREKRSAELEAKIRHLTKHLEPQAMSALFEQVEEDVKQEQRIKELEAQVKYWKSEYDKLFNED